MIQTKGLTRIFKSDEIETIALMDVSFNVKEGEFVAIMGPSGCGKSTLLNILGLLDSPTSGEFKFRGEEVSRYTEKQRAHLRKEKVGFIFQNFNLIEELTVFENVELPLMYLGVGSRERKISVTKVLERLEMIARRNHFPVQLSGGQQQRVAIARALVPRPSLILADEPTGNLDSARGEEVMNLLGELNDGGATIIMVTHSQRDAEFASRLVNLFDGQIVTERR
jgi:putative ABC transport system ATP-binding protein